MTTLDYENLTRTESDPATIATLIRKGWVARPEKPATAANEKLAWVEGQWTKTKLEEAETSILAVQSKLTEAEREAIVQQAKIDIDAELLNAWSRRKTLSELVAKGTITKERAKELLS